MARSHAQHTLLSHLTSPDSLDFLFEEGFGDPEKREAIPSDTVKNIVEWALNYYFENERVTAPSKEAILETWGDDLEAVELVIEDEVEPDSIQWAVGQLRDQRIYVASGQIVKNTAIAVDKAGPGEKIAAVQQGAWDLYQLGRSVTSRRNHVEALPLYRTAMDRYFQRATTGNVMRGMMFGEELEDINRCYYGVHPGEIVTLAAGTGVGKSWMAADTTLSEWRRGRKTVLWTLENDTDMTGDRLICMHAKVSYGKWQEGSCSEAEIEAVDQAFQEIEASDKRFEVIMPDARERTVLDIVRQSLILGADSITVDQLTFIEHVNKRDPLWKQIGDTMHELKSLISEAGVSCLLLHQVNREGVAHARKTGRFETDHMSGGAEIERTSDFVVGLYQSPDMRALHEAQWQTLKARRVPPRDWDLAFNPGIGDIRVVGEVVSA